MIKKGGQEILTEIPQEPIEPSFGKKFSEWLYYNKDLIKFLIVSVISIIIIIILMTTPISGMIGRPYYRGGCYYDPYLKKYKCICGKKILFR